MVEIDQNSDDQKMRQKYILSNLDFFHNHLISSQGS